MKRAGKKSAKKRAKRAATKSARKPAKKTKRALSARPRKSPSTSKRPKKGSAPEPSAAELIDRRIAELAGWRGATLARMRALILAADPAMTEEWKWAVPVWSHHGIVCTGESYKSVVKLTFARGAAVPDPARMFNSSLEGNTRRAIDIHEGGEIDEAAFKALVTAAVAVNAEAKDQ
jgi:hypothetical protein